MTPKVISAAARGSASGGRPARQARAGLLALALVLTAPACNFGESGVPPPSDRIFLPTGLAVDPAGRWLYVVNSNFDLRYNAGTVTAVNLQKADDDRAAKGWPGCPTPSYQPPAAPARACCYDFFDRETLNCNDRNYIDPGTTVRTGSFGGAILVDQIDDARRRLFVLVRAEPSVTFINTTLENPTTPASRVTFKCTGSGPSSEATCDDAWKIMGSRDTAVTYALQEEPYTFALDTKLRILYVGHLFSGVTALDLCRTGDNESPALAGVNPRIFSSGAEGVTTLTLADPGNPLAPLFATGHVLSSAGAAEIRPLYLRDGAALEKCPEGGLARGKNTLELIPGDPFFSSAFFPSGRDIRGLVQSPDGRRIFLLHRNTGTRDNPAALVTIDRTLDAHGEPVNRAIDAVEICGGATQLSWHDSGRGPRLFVVCFESGQLYVVDPELMVVSAIVNAGRGPTALAFSPTNPAIAFFTGFTDNSVSVVDLEPGSPTEYRVVQRIGFPHASGQ